MVNKTHSFNVLLQTVVIFLFGTVFCISNSFAETQEVQYKYETEIQTLSGTKVVVPDDISWTQRFILAEMKELRTDLEKTKRELNIELNNRELASVDRALSYSGNTVNFLWLIMTIAVAGFGIVGWKTMKDVRDNLNKNFGKEIQKNVNVQQKHLEEFISKFKEEQLLESGKLLRNQEEITKKQEASYIWSQYNREEDMVVRLELLDSIDTLDLEENELLIFTERANVYIIIGLWDKALENAEKGLEISSENTSLLLSKAQSLAMLDNIEEALSVITNIIVIRPSSKDELLEMTMFEKLHDEINAISVEQGNTYAETTLKI